MDKNFENLFSAVQALHNNNIIHRDIKSENIMTDVDLSIVTETNKPNIDLYLIDFGVSL